jgi:uncharacterized membrane protein
LLKPFLPDSLYKFLFALLGLLYIIGLFVPLMDNDAAHHANIALHMHLTGDYVSLVDQNGDYLDKPHLLFWLSAFSYKIFGVTSFAYKLPSLLFTILCIYSTYRLGKTLYNREVGKLASLLLASAFAFMLANNDVRMEAILTACIAFSSWQLVDFVQQKKIINILGAAIGLALGFATKGMIAVFVPAIGSFFYILYGKDYKLLLNWKWLLLIVLFAAFISPVLYCYYLQYNLHPEKIVRGKDHINGIKFILFNQSVERFGGKTGDVSKQDHFFFLHSFLWAFAPWSILVYMAIIVRFKNYLKRDIEWFTVSTFVVVLLLVSFSGFKLPHYLNIIFPVAAVIAAAFIIGSQSSVVWTKRIFIIQFVVAVILILAAGSINIWAFPVHGWWSLTMVVLLLALVFYFMKSSMFSSLQKSVLMPVATMILFFFLLNNNFYPQLLKYQGGNELAFKTKDKIDPKQVYFWRETQSSSFNFYTKTLRQQFSDSTLDGKEKVWLLYDIKDEAQIKQQYKIVQRFETVDYEITKIDLKFMNPDKRLSVCTKMIVSEIWR